MTRSTGRRQAPLTLLGLLAVTALGGPPASAATCGGPLPPVPPLSGVSRDDVAGVRTLVDARRDAQARSRWSALTAWSPAAGATAYGKADALFTSRNYRAAFASYGRFLFCATTTELNPAANDSGAAPLLERALARAANGDFSAAQRLLTTAAARDPASLESDYFLGLVAFARGDASTARTAWRAAIDSDGYAQPPDGWTLTRAQQAAFQRYLAEPARAPAHTDASSG